MYLIFPTFARIAPFCVKWYRRIKFLPQLYFANKGIKYLKKNKEKILEQGRNGYKFTINELGLQQEMLELLKYKLKQSREVVIGEIDQDGFILSHFGLFRNAPIISKENFLRRKRFILQLVAIDQYVGVKKNYKGNILCFKNAIIALHNLGKAGVNVPAILDIDFDRICLTFSYILGSVLREELAKKGAVLRDRDVEDNPEFIVSLKKNERDLKRINEGKQILYDVVTRQFVDDLFDELKRVHEAGFIWSEIKYGNIIIEKKSEKPYLLDFDSARFYPHLEKNFFRPLRDEEIEKFNLHFNTKKVSYNRIKNKISRMKHEEVYAPIYFGVNLWLGNIWMNGSGYGRWHYILKQNLPSFIGKRILDLGSNNGFTALQMLRNGAREVIGIEMDGTYISQGCFIKDSFEYIDNRLYNFRYIQTNMKEIPHMNLGTFDMVCAFCSIYYLDHTSIIRLVEYVRSITDVFVWQCNTKKNLNRSDPHTYEKASIEYAEKVLTDNGFTNTHIIDPRGYTRPLIIGRKRT
jgi:tRNA A-37 threonylcarbamoyl transferase component Bud32/SAM-dependent methyltransferase